MKNLALLLILILAQGMVFGAGMPTPTVPKVLPNTPMNRLTIRLRQQNIQIQREVKAGKLTKAQAKTLKAQVDAIRKQESADLKANPSTSSGRAGTKPSPTPRWPNSTTSSTVAHHPF